jgi:hypothetical protein
LTPLSLAQRILELEQALAEIPHAFGGALALAYYAEPRATVDIDLNVFVPVEQFPDVARPLLDVGASVDEAVAESVRRDGQARVMWDDTPIDLFFAYDPFHDAAARSRRTVPFADGSIPILSAEHLIVCKAVFNRPKDWIDIEAVLITGVALDIAEVLRWTGRIAGDEDPRFERLAALLARR